MSVPVLERIETFAGASDADREAWLADRRGGVTATEQIVARFASKIMIDPETDCWYWQGHLSRTGYGEFWVGHERHTAHRWSYLLFVGPLPDELVLDHLCRNRGCVNPKHVEPVTNGENVLRGEGHSALNARKTHCVRNHPLPDERDGSGRRICRECKSEESRRWNEKNREKAAENTRRYREAHRDEINERKRARRAGR